MSFRSIATVLLTGLSAAFFTNCKEPTTAQKATPNTETTKTDETAAGADGAATDAPTDAGPADDGGTDLADGTLADGGDGAPVVPSISGAISSLALSIGGTEVVAYPVDATGARGAALGSSKLTAQGQFSIPMPASVGTIELALEPTGMGLTTPTSIVRTRISPTSAGAKVALNEITELAMQRLVAKIDGGETVERATKLAFAEASALTGVPDVRAMPVPVTADATESNQAAQRYGLVLAGLARRSDANGADAADTLAALKADFTDGTINEKTVFHRGYAEDLRRAMKDEIRTASSTPLDFNDIPSIDAAAASLVQTADFNGTLDTFAPPEPSPFQHFIEFEPQAGMATSYDSLTSCIGPMRMRRVDAKGQALASGPALPVVLGSSGSTWNYYTAADCDNATIISTVTIGTGSDASSLFYLKPIQYSYDSLIAYVSASDVAAVESAFHYIDPIYMGKLIANSIAVELTMDVNNMYLFDRNTCIPGTFKLTCGYFNCSTNGTPTSGIRPQNTTVNATMSFANLNVTGTIALYSNAACTTSASSFVVAAGQESVPFYIKSSADFSQGFGTYSLVTTSLDVIPTSVGDSSAPNIYIRK